ncbi:unnamed protein product [Vitrella brassicaformis CCMP3155]|uniref:Uncharacterized protein n=1 Tax=Vitrella brassicaformis (strain CCMP3155) TaxID=1169540 RepID=A0A0G4GEY2_VITBC|nr:unnamed protein product [Vitrella brassicaformis CCMP3155]|eukprot:CEM28081.1 unnamed protein product [Vitrella brassicaformis CCMP3155]
MWRPLPILGWRDVFDVAGCPSSCPAWKGPAYPKKPSPRCNNRGGDHVLVHYKGHAEVCRFPLRASVEDTMVVVREKFGPHGLEPNRLVRFVSPYGQVVDPLHLFSYESVALWLGPLWTPEQEEVWRRENAPSWVKWLRRNLRGQKVEQRAPTEDHQPLLAHHGDLVVQGQP